MSNNNSEVDHENVNGFKLSLKIDKRSGSPNSRHFTVSYKNIEFKVSWPMKTLFLSIVLNFIALNYVHINLTVILVAIIGISYLVFFSVTHSVQSESLLVIPTVGIQSTVKYICGREDNFVQWSKIDDVIINEVIKLNRVLYYLTVIVKSDDQSTSEPEAMKLITLFKYTKPRLFMLEKIYSEMQALLIDSQNQDSTLGSGDVG